MSTGNPLPSQGQPSRGIREALALAHVGRLDEAEDVCRALVADAPRHFEARWLLDRDDSPWYPSLRLFRQTTPNDWQEAVERLAGVPA